MATTGRNHLTTSHDRSPFILERRRKLFPIDDYDVDSDLGPISPLCFDTSSDSENEGVNSISSFDFVGVVQNNTVGGNKTPVSNKSWSETMSPLKLSPATSLRDMSQKYSPSCNLKTPHDTSTKPVLQKEQKTLLEESKSLKRKFSPTSSPEQNKILKADKNSKVRTALFPPEEDIFAPLSTKSFYSKKQENISEKLGIKREEKYVPKHIKFSAAKHRYRSKKFGQINNGVGHKIRKPKQRQMSKALVTQAMKKMLETAPALNEYIQDLKELTNKHNSDSKLIVSATIVPENIDIIKSGEEPQLQEDLHCISKLPPTKKLILTPVKQIQTYNEANKENIQNECQYESVIPLSLSSPEETKSRKFFKSSRAKAHSKQGKVLQKNKNLESKLNDDKNEIKNSYLNDQTQQISNKVLLERSNDFEYDDMEPEANIDNILSVLLGESPQKKVVDQKACEKPPQHFENVCPSNLDLPNSTPNVLNDHRNVVSQGIEQTSVVNQSECGKSLEYFENYCQTGFDASKLNFNVVNTLNSLASHNGQGDTYIQGYGCENDWQTASRSTSGIYQRVDETLHVPNNSSNRCLGNTVYIMEADRGVAPVCGHSSSLEANLPGIPTEFCDNNTSEPRIVSSQVVFNDILDEDQTVIHASPNQDASFSTVSNVTNPLESSKIPNCSNRITLEAHNSVLASENSIQLHHSNAANTILSPISQMCDVTSGLALNSPKRGRNLSGLLNNMTRASKILSFTASHSVDMEQQQQKLFPVFYPGAKAVPQRGEKRESGEVKRSAKKFKALSEDQMLLDAGQKNFGYTVCNECNIVYHMGDPGDEIEHSNYHNANHILRFAGWRNEHIVADFQKNGRIIRILPTDSKIWLKKVKDLMEFVKRDLGCYEMEYDISESQVYLCIKNRTIAGCAVATVPKEGGHRMLSSMSGVAMCSEESYPIKCGVSHIWVAANFRKQGVATALMNAVKNNFSYGYILTDSDIALTSPTEAGSAFAEKYFKTPNYFVYYT